MPFAIPIGASDPTIRHIPKFGGELWFVSANISASGDGKTPDTAFKTIGEAIAACSAGDAITVMAGTYDVADTITLNKNNIEMWCEIGTIIKNTTDNDNILEISGSYCWFGCHDGAVLIDNTNGTGTGVVSSGNFNYFEDVRVSCGRSGSIGFDITGNGNDLRLCRCSEPTTAAFKVQGDSCILRECCTGATPADASIGYWITNNSDKFRADGCGAQGHGAYAMQVDSGCTNGCVKNFSSGGGDNGLLNNGSNFAITSYDWDENVCAITTFSGGSPGSLNMFKVSGVVQVNRIYGVVTTVLSADVDNIKLELDDGAVQANITLTVDSDSAPVGSLFIKDDDNAVALDLQKSDQVRILEPTVSPQKGAQSPFDIITKNGATNYIRLNVSGVATSGAIKWCIDWTPLSEDGVVKEA